MKIKKIDSFYIITKIKEHNEIKNKLLSLINKMPDSKFDNVSKTDWNIHADFKREYLEFFYGMIIPYMSKMTNLLKENKWWIRNAWFQQYNKNSHHEWHRHPQANFTNVYYLELPEKNMTTKILNEINNEIIDIPSKEGDLITFPAYMLHCSKPILKNTRKTIISFNSCFGK